MSGLRTPSRIGKRTRYITDAELLGSSMDREQQEQQFENNNVNENSDPQTGATVAGTTGTTATTTTTSTTPEANPSIQSELEQTKRLVSVFETIDLSVTEARDKLKTFYKTADETNALLDMWIRVLSQSEHTQKLLHDPAWEGQSMEEARDKEHQERRAAYQQAMEEANRRHSYGASPNIINNHNPHSTSSLFASSIAGTHTHSPSATATTAGFGSISTSSLSSMHPNTSNSHLYNSHKPLKKSPSALVAAAHAHASAIAANRKRNAAGGYSGLPKATTKIV